MMPRLSGRKVYQQSPEETDEQYQKFSAFRDFGPDRSIDEACRLFYFNQKKSPTMENLSEWEQLAANFDWQARALIFDADQAIARQEAFDAKQKALVEKYRLDTIELGQMQLDISKRAYELIMVKLSNITHAQAQKLDYRDMNEMGKMAIQLTDAGLINLHNGLSIDDLLEKMNMVKAKKGSNILSMKKASSK